MDEETRNYLDGMRQELAGQFGAIGGRFDAIGGQFAVIDGQFEAIGGRFDAIDGRFDAIDGRFEAIDGRLDGMDRRLGGNDRRFEAMERRITEEAQQTRRHFDVVAEDMLNAVRQVAADAARQMEAVDRLRDEMHAEFRARDVVLHAAFTEIRRDIADLRQRL